MILKLYVRDGGQIYVENIFSNNPQVPLGNRD